MHDRSVRGPNISAAAPGPFPETCTNQLRRLDQLSIQGRKALIVGQAQPCWTVAIAVRFESVREIPVLTIPTHPDVPSDPGHNSIDAVFCLDGVGYNDPEELLVGINRILVGGGLAYLRYPTIAYAESKVERDKAGACELYLARMSYVLDTSHLVDFVRLGNGALLADLLSAEADRLKLRRRSLFSLRNHCSSERLVKAVVTGRPSSHVETVYRRYVQDEGERPGSFAQCVRECVLGVWRRAFSSAAEFDDTAQVLASMLERILNLSSRDQRRRLCLDLVSRLLLGTGDGGLRGLQIPLAPEELLRASVNTGFSEVGTAEIDWLVVDPEVEGTSREGDLLPGWFETVLRKTSSIGLDDWPPPKYFRGSTRAGLSQRQPAHSALIGSARLSQTVDRKFTSKMRSVAATFVGLPVLERLVEQVILGHDEEGAFHALYGFIQDSLFHHPTVQPLAKDGSAELDVPTLLLGGIARCGHVAEVAKTLFELLGYPAKVTQLHRHLCAEVKVGDKWRIVDADVFKAGIYPTTQDGDWASLDEARADMALLDRSPALGLVLSPSAPWARDDVGKVVEGYVDTGMPWHRPYLSHLYFGAQTGMPPEPPSLRVEQCAGGPHLRFGSIGSEIKALDVMVDTCSRGWSYSDVPGPEFLRRPCGGIIDIRIEPGALTLGFEIPSSAGKLFISVVARDQRGLDDPEIHYWPGPECQWSVPAESLS